MIQHSRAIGYISQLIISLRLSKVTCQTPICSHHALRGRGPRFARTHSFQSLRDTYPCQLYSSLSQSYCLLYGGGWLFGSGKDLADGESWSAFIIMMGKYCWMKLSV